MNDPGSDSKKDQLDWQAFLYLSDELEPAKRQDFENLLTRDQAARDAVTRQVLLARSLDSHFESTETATGRGTDKGERIAARPDVTPAISKSAWVLAATVLIAIFAIAWTIQANRQNENAAADIDEQLLDAWEFTKLNQVDFSTDDELSIQDAVDEIEFADNSALPESSIDADQDVNLDDSWMALALLDIDESPDDKN